MSVKERTARLTTGQPSLETPTVQPSWKARRQGSPIPMVSHPNSQSATELEKLSQDIEESIRWTQDMAYLSYSSESIAPPLGSCNMKMVNRPQWISFILCLQMHFSDLGTEIGAAYDIGKVPPVRVVLSEEAISFLNKMIEVWYEGDVEVVTIESGDVARDLLRPAQEVHYRPPFRPVTGLRVTVTPTVQQAKKRRDQKILEEKSQWGYLEKFRVLREAHRLLVREIVGDATIIKDTSVRSLWRGLSTSKK